jgi:hypothetical protein
VANAVVKSKVSLGTSGAIPQTDTYTAISGVTNIGEFGDEVEIIKIQTIDTGRAAKVKGTADAGTFELEVAREMGDAGQIALRAAALSDAEFNLKIEANDRANDSAGSKPTTQYLRGLVTEKHKFGAANDVVSQTFVFELTAAPITVPAQAA